jgi:hypothetical protein
VLDQHVVVVVAALHKNTALGPILQPLHSQQQLQRCGWD